MKSENLGGGLLDVGYQVAPVLLLLEAGEDHLGAGDVLLGVLEVDVKGVLVPGDADVGRGEGEPPSLLATILRQTVIHITNQQI